VFKLVQDWLVCTVCSLACDLELGTCIWIEVGLLAIDFTGTGTVAVINFIFQEQ